MEVSPLPPTHKNKIATNSIKESWDYCYDDDESLEEYWNFRLEIVRRPCQASMIESFAKIIKGALIL